MKSLRLDFIRIKQVKAVTFFLLVSLCILLRSVAWGRIRIDIYGPELVPFPIAIAPFSWAKGANQEMANQVESILVNDLKISGFFKVSGPKIIASTDLGSIKDPDKVDLAPWIGKPYEALVSGGVEIDIDRLLVHFRLFDLVEESFVTGLKYSAPFEDVRKVSHRMADEITFHLTGQIGVASTKIAFISNQSGIKEVYIIDFDGYGLTRVTDHNSLCMAPAWSPNGKNLAYTCFKQRNPDLYIYDLGRHSFKIVSSRDGVNSAPAWSPEGTRMAVMIRKDDKTKIAVIDINNSSKPLFFTSGGGNEASPAWSPDGQRLAFLSDRSGSPQIYTFDIDGKKLKRITFEGNYNASPSWSPLGDRIAFCSMINGSFDIFTCNPDGRDMQRLTQNAGNNEDPVWSPDGRFIAFSSDRSGRSHIYCINANGANTRQITFSRFQETEPAWSPYLL